MNGEKPLATDVGTVSVVTYFDTNLRSFKLFASV